MHKKILDAPVPLDAAELDEASKALIGQLLEREPIARLGHGATATSMVRRDAFWTSLDWDKVLAHGYAPGWAPPLSLIHI